MPQPIRCLPKSLYIEREGALRGRWYCRVPVEHDADTVASPAYFGDEIARQNRLREGDVIEVEPADMSWYGELVVRAVMPDLREVLTRWRGAPQMFDAADESDGFSVKFGGPAHRWRIMRGEQVVEAGFPTKEAALMRAQHLRQAA